MHKTGTSSIQATLVKLKPEGWTFRDDADGNMSYLVPLLFEKNPENYSSFKARGLSASKISQIREHQFASLHEKLALAREQSTNAIFTAEDISSASESAVQAIRDLYLSYGFNIRVVAYVRSPVSFMQSAFQQGLKSGLKTLFHETATNPNYRTRFEKMDRIFGRDKVVLKIFDPRNLVSGDVCIDFFSELGLKIDHDQVVRVNESMSLEACALLFAQRSLGQGFVQGFEGVHAKNFAFFSSLSAVGTGKFRFKRSFVESIIERYRHDIDWMEERLGSPILDLPEEDEPDSIGSEEDLLHIADRNLDALEDLLFREICKQGDAPRDRLIRNLELLRKMHY